MRPVGNVQYCSDTLLENLTNDAIAYISMWLNFWPFPSILLNFSNFRALQ